MKKLYTILFVVAMSLFVSCDRENSDGISNEMAIKMSVSVDKTKAILTTDNIINTSIGVFGYKEQISNQNNKYLVFNNEKLSFESDSWAYSPVRYWDTQTAYSFIAYAPYQENSDDVSVNDFEGITINGIPQWQDADAIESKDYVVALTDSAATNYINNGGVDLKFHHILANLKITAFKEGDSDFEIQNIIIGADIDNQRVPEVGVERRYAQNFGSERADGSFSDVTLNGTSISLFAGNMAVESAISKVANLLVAPFIAGADLPLTITYTENGAEKSAVVNSGITEFKSDAVYTVNLKFTSTEVEVQLGAFGPGIYNVELAGWAYSITDEARMNVLSFDYNSGNPIVKSISSNYHGEILWQCQDEITANNAQKLFIEHPINDGTIVIYYLTVDESCNLIVTQNSNDACTFKDLNPHIPGYSLGCYDKNGNYVGRIYWNKAEERFVIDPIVNVGGELSNSRSWRTSNIVECDVENGFAGPAIYVNNAGSFNGFNIYTKELSYGGYLDFDAVASTSKFQYYYDGNMSRFYVDDSPNMYQSPPNQVYTGWQWSLEGADGYATIDNSGKISYNNVAPNDIIVTITVRGIAVYNPLTYIEGYYRLKLKAAN